ncbi:MAG: tyrosine recombinase XerC [Gammaproteobacteria bacterium]|nr:MAG: tyrosine recombinase XerC [Gammaproteobacteria bacterium]
MFETELDNFFRFLETEKRYSVHTLSNYRRDIQGFIHYCQQLKLNWLSIDNQHVRSYVAQVHRKGLSGKSIQRLLSSLRSLFRFLLKQHKVKHNPVVGVSAPKSPRKLPEVLTADSLDHLLSLDQDDPLAVRDMAMMELLYGCGLRLSELVGLDLNHIEWQGQTLNVLGKGRKQRRVPFGEKAHAALKTWLKTRGTLAAEDETAVFVSQRGQRISHGSVQQRLKKWALVKGLDRNVYPHLMRHSFASHILESSHDLRAVQELLGHANLSTTQIYTHLDFQHLAKVYDAAHPRARKKPVKS